MFHGWMSCGLFLWNLLTAWCTVNTKLCFQVVGEFTLIQNAACLSEVSKCIWFQTAVRSCGAVHSTRQIQVLGQQRSFSRCAQPGRSYSVLDSREIYGVQILSDFHVQSKTSPFSFPIHITTQKRCLADPPECHRYPSLELLNWGMCCGWNDHQISSTSSILFLVENGINELPWKGLEAQEGGAGDKERPCCVALHWHLLPDREQNYPRQLRGGSGCDRIPLGGTFLKLLSLLQLLHIGSHCKAVSEHTNQIAFFAETKRGSFITASQLVVTSHPQVLRPQDQSWANPPWTGLLQFLASQPQLFHHTHPLPLWFSDCQHRQLQASKGILVGRVGAACAQACTLKNPSLSC